MKALFLLREANLRLSELRPAQSYLGKECMDKQRRHLKTKEDGELEPVPRTGLSTERGNRSKHQSQTSTPTRSFPGPALLIRSVSSHRQIVAASSWSRCFLKSGNQQPVIRIMIPGDLSGLNLNSYQQLRMQDGRSRHKSRLVKRTLSWVELDPNSPSTHKWKSYPSI